MRFSYASSYRRAFVDITPMIDVVFNLLLFFIVATMLEGRQGIKVNLPPAETAKKEAVSKLSEITINEQLEFYIGEKKIKVSNLYPHLVKESELSTDKTLLIRSDGTVPHKIVILVMDEATKAGFEKLSFATKQIK